MIKETKVVEIFTENTPEVIIVKNSNWSGYFHVIMEDPEQGDLYHEHEFLPKDEVERIYNINLDEYFE